MKRFQVKFVREFEVEIQAGDTEEAAQLARKVIEQFPPDTCKLLSVIEEGCVVAEEDASKPRTPPRGGPPNLGGSPGTPVIRAPEIVDQVAEAA